MTHRRLLDANPDDTDRATARAFADPIAGFQFPPDFLHPIAFGKK